jgi:D-arabinose 1-dehydrogenase-like Zn-dependent alcohol dehydrogenase
MKAILARGPGHFDEVDIAEPVVPQGGRLLRVEATGVCAADRMLWNGTGPWQLRWPFVPGHEILGRDVDTGERLTVEVSVPCGQCGFCKAGRTGRRATSGQRCPVASPSGSRCPPMP